MREQTVKQHHHVNLNIEINIIKYGINITDGPKWYTDNFS